MINTVIMTMDDFSEFPTEEEVKATIRPKEECYRAVNEYNLAGEYLNTYNSVSQAFLKTGVCVSSIGNCLKGRVLCIPSRSRIFLYRGDDIEKRLALIEQARQDKRKKGTIKQIDEYSLQGRYLFTYPTMKAAAKANDITSGIVYKCCIGKYLYVDKRIFLYHGEDIKQRMPAVREALYYERTRRKKCRPVDEYTLDGEFVKAWPSGSAASREYGIHVSSILRCCHGIDSKKHNAYTIHGKIFLFTGESISERLELIKQNKK